MLAEMNKKYFECTLGGKHRVIPLEDILFIEAEDKYTYIFTRGNERFCIRKTLKESIMVKYYASKYLWIPFVFAFTGIIMMIFVLVDTIMYGQAGINGKKNLLTIKPGQYTEIVFDELLMNNLGYPVDNVLGYYSGTYDRCVIVNQDAYIQVEFSPDGEAAKKIADFRSGKGEAVSIVAKGIWSELSELSQEMVPTLNDKVMCDVVFREISVSEWEIQRKNKLILAGGLLAVAVVLLFTRLGICRAKGDSLSEQYQKLELELKNNYNKEGELLRELRRKEELQEKQKGMKWKVLFFVFISLLGGSGFIKLYIHFEETYPIYLTAFMAVVFYFGLIQAWKALLNTGWGPALTISKAFSVHSIPVELEEISITVWILRRQMNEQKYDV